MSTLPIKHKPFNLEHAKAGAPYATRGGDVATVLKWDGRHSIYPLTGVAGNDDYMICWTASGKYTPADGDDRNDLVMTPLGYIDGEPVFWDSKIETISDGIPVDGHVGAFHGMELYRWPVPAKVYPQISMKQNDVRDAIERMRADNLNMSMSVKTSGKIGNRSTLEVELYGDGSTIGAWNAVASAALRHAIDAGQVVTEADHLAAIAAVQAKLYRAERALTRAGFVDHGAEEWSSPVAPHIRDAERDMAIAKAVLDVAYTRVMNSQAGHEGTVVRQIDLAAIIAKVPA